jgi:hypothetical protein
MEIGRTYRRSEQWSEALNYYQKAVDLDPSNPGALTGLGLCYLRLNQGERALDILLQSVEQLYVQPRAHLYIGEALMYLEKWKEAVVALELARSFKPGDKNILYHLKDIYTEKLNERDKADEIQREIDRFGSPVIIVSGLPRSGTSLVMQMLNAAGVPILTDDHRPADEHNPKGYFELNATTKTGYKWLDGAEGKAVKVVAPLLCKLPPVKDYRVIFVERPISEVVLSQEVMRGVERKEAIKRFPLKLASILEEQKEQSLRWIESQAHVQFITLDFHQILSRDSTIPAQLGALIGDSFQWDKVFDPVDKELYRSGA